MTRIRLDAVSKTLGTTLAVAHASLEIDSGELFFLLGPSGCGKTTLLNLIAGLEVPDTGRIYFDARDVTTVPTARRNAVLCFQSFALFPHMTVEKNVRFGLDARKLSGPEQERRVADVLGLARLTELRGRKPSELSGGQQQRVALARALAVEPSCLLLDEPLSSLDVQLRYELRGELRRMCKQSGHTTVYVTHDQKEALSMADRIAVMTGGQIAQIGTARDLFERPRTAFVAQFISQSNILCGPVVARGALIRVQTAAGDLSVPEQVVASSKSALTLAIRPDRFRFLPAGHSAGENCLRGKVLESSFLGDSSEHRIQVGDAILRVTHSPPRFDMPEQLTLQLDPSHVTVVEE